MCELKSLLTRLVGTCLLAASAMAQSGTHPSSRPSDGQGPAEPRRLWLYVGTYTSPQTGSKGIYLLEMDPRSGGLKSLGLAAETASPAFLAVHPSHRFLYAVGELDQFQGTKSGAVNAFAINPDSGKLTLLNQQPSGGPGPCHVSVDSVGKHVLVANYGGGSVSALPIDQDGRLGKPTAVVQHQGSGPNPTRQQGPHAHSIVLDPSGCYAMAPDLGLDQILIYRFGVTEGTLTPNEQPAAKVAPGAGPRHFAFDPKGRFAYVINELASTVTAFAYNARLGALYEVQTISTLPAAFSGSNTTADIHVHPSGKFLYGSNRGHDSIAIFAIDAQTGRLAAVGHEPTRGKTPRNFGIDPSGTWLLAANQQSNSVIVFRIDPRTGLLHATGTSAEVPSPICIKFVPLER